MSTVIAVYNSEVCRPLRRPLPRRTATGLRLHLRWRLHGCGSERAIAQNTDDLGIDALLQSWAERHDMAPDG